MKVIFSPCGVLSFPRKLIKEIFESEYTSKYFFDTRNLTQCDIFSNMNQSIDNNITYSLVGDFATNVAVYSSIDELFNTCSEGFVIKDNIIYYVNSSKLLFDRNDEYIITLIKKHNCPFIRMIEIPDNHLFTILFINGKEHVLHFPCNQPDINTELINQTKTDIEDIICDTTK